MLITATITNLAKENSISVSTNGIEKNISIPGKIEGRGSSVNGGELLFLSLATCFCNDIYREAARRNMEIVSVDVTVTGQFGKEGEAGSEISYEATITAPGNSQQEIDDLILHVDRIAEIHNTLRKGVNVLLKR